MTLYTMYYPYLSPLGEIIIQCDHEAITGLWLPTQWKGPWPNMERNAGFPPVVEDAVRWLDIYFTGHDPGPAPKVSFSGSDFQKAVWRQLLLIPYGMATTYGAIAKKVAQELGRRPCARAVGGAVGANPISIIVPCHRVLGAHNAITGYTGGLDAKRFLLNLEKIPLFDPLPLPSLHL